MTINIGINGYGRIGRNILRALYESNQHKNLQIVAINDVGDNAVSAHLTKYDSLIYLCRLITSSYTYFSLTKTF